MKIHKVRENETLKDIAKNYETSVERILENNGLKSERLAIGQELLILKPTRTYVAKGDDTAAAIACRFGTKLQTLMANNPMLRAQNLKDGRELAIKYQTPTFGAAAANGYFYKGTLLGRLKQLIPYVTYLTVSAYKLDGGRLTRLFDPRAAVRLAKENGKVVLMRVYDVTGGEVLCDKKARGELIDALISAASVGGFGGITLSAHRAARECPSEFSEFLVEMRRSMIGCDMILFTETNSELSEDVSELADGSVFMYGKCELENPPSFDDGERRVLADFSERAETSKALLYINTDALCNGRYVPYSEAIDTAVQYGCEIKSDDKTLLSHYDLKEKQVRFESLENTKAKLELVSELGFMGAAFDIRTVCAEHLMMLGAMFAPVHYQIPFSYAPEKGQMY